MVKKLRSLIALIKDKIYFIMLRLCFINTFELNILIRERIAHIQKFIAIRIFAKENNMKIV